jgi:DNA polymerase
MQLEWGADEFLLDTPQDRRQAAAPPPPPAARPAPRLATSTPALPAGPAEAARIAAACTTLAELEAAVRQFTSCPLRTTATTTVFGSGPETARLMMVGDAPGAEEDRSGTPFAGPAGQLLDKMLLSIGQNRTTIRLANILPWRPPGDRNPSEAEIALCLPFIQRHISLVRPDILVLLGAIAARALLPEAIGTQGIRRLRGRWREVDIAGPIACLPLYHPAYLLHLPSAKRDAWHDLLALKERL